MKYHPFNVRLGKILREKRRAQHLTQAEVGEVAGIGKGHVCHIERGRNPSVLSLHRMAKGLHVSAADILEEVDQSFRITKP